MSDPQQPAQNPHHLPPYISQQPQGGYPAQQPQAGYPAQDPAPRTGNPAGRIGLILGIVALGINVVTSIVFQIMIRTDGYRLYGLINGVGAFLAFAAGLAALICGFVGLRRSGTPQAAAGIAAGIGIAVVAGTAFSFMINSVGSLMPF
ncbi:hypothetical protein [Microbacterium sp.]|uniref:hypothetical protein n=1 Tax=Microbacterium sp. TaxID=51671 RepID=UPI003F94765E